MKKLFALVIIISLLLSGCGSEKIGTDYDFSKVAEETMSAIMDSAKNPGHSSIFGEWSVIVAVRYGAKVPDGWYDIYYNNLCETMVKENGILSSTKHSNYSRAVIALTAAGKDITNVSGYNLIDNYKDFDTITKQGLPGAIFALIAFDTVGYDFPEDGNVTREILIDYILEEEYEVGGWALQGENPDVDITAQVIQALAPYYGKDENITAAVNRAVEHLSDVQKPDGGFFAWEGENAQSAAQVVIALTSVGVDIRNDERFIKGENWIGSYLMTYYLGGGAFCHTIGLGKDPMATDQCMQALIALDLFDKGEGRFYDFSDIN